MILLTDFQFSLKWKKWNNSPMFLCGIYKQYWRILITFWMTFQWISQLPFLNLNIFHTLCNTSCLMLLMAPLDYLRLDFCLNKIGRLNRMVFYIFFVSPITILWFNWMQTGMCAQCHSQIFDQIWCSFA